ncbi:reticuline oxidase [Ceratobasidium sp. AG-Ba]|nr:reticuline oxidase [Ceratobasidium sp. AG-Ba]
MIERWNLSQAVKMLAWTTLLLQTFTLASAAAVDNNNAFISCLKADGSNSSVVLTPSSATYDVSATANWNTRIRYDPAAIVYPKATSDVQKYVRCGAKFNIPVVGRSGGHSYALFGVGGQDGSLVIDVSNMTSFSINASGSAKFQTGNKLGDIAQKLWDNGKRALPHGTCPYVGSGGHTAFGGFGPYSRVAGLLHDRVTSAQVVLADGTLTTASATKNKDLFWALRGAGASYGIVTEWTFATLPAPPVVISYKVDYTAIALSPMQVRDLMEKWQQIALGAPDEMSVICTIGKLWLNNGTSIFLEYRGTYYGTKDRFDSITANWKSILSPGNFTSVVNDWYGGLVAISGPLAVNGTEMQVPMFAKSWFAKKPVTTAQWTSLFEYLGTDGLAFDGYWYIETDRYGGGVAKQPADATAFAHRDAMMGFQLVSLSLPGPFPPDGIPFLDGALHALEPNPKAAYVNYVDPTLTPAQWKQQYYGSHYKRLSSIKRAVDPHNVFRFPQSISLSS